MLQIIFSSCKEDVIEFVGRVCCHVAKHLDFLSVKPSINYMTGSGAVVTFNFDFRVQWSWTSANCFISTLQTIARNNDLHVEVIGVLFN